MYNDTLCAEISLLCADIHRAEFRLLQLIDRAMDWLFRGQPHRARLRHDDARVEDAAVLATESTRRIACDSALVRILTTDDGEVLDVGPKARVIPPSILGSWEWGGAN